MINTKFDMYIKKIKKLQFVKILKYIVMFISTDSYIKILLNLYLDLLKKKKFGSKVVRKPNGLQPPLTPPKCSIFYSVLCLSLSLHRS